MLRSDQPREGSSPDQVRMDPLNLLNPGKFDFGNEAEPKQVHALPTRGWTYQRAKSA